MRALGRLWRGELPLADAFWTWTVLVGLAVNLTTTFLFLICITLDQTVLALITGYLFSVPYNVLAVVGVWRAAERERRPGPSADVYRVAALVLMLVLSLT